MSAKPHDLLGVEREKVVFEDACGGFVELLNFLTCGLDAFATVVQVA